MGSDKPATGGIGARPVAAAQRDRESGYREKALKLFPWICGRCAREFSGKNLSQLTVHHKDHNHDNNPPDGSNWELLCLFCHDNEHSKYVDQVRYGSDSPARSNEPAPATNKAFAHLGELLKKGGDKE
jgi:hypothetical protein